MKLVTILGLLFIQLFSIVFAVDVEFQQNGGVKDVEVKKDTEFSVLLKGNPTTGNSWYLNNVDEVKGNGIEPLNLNEYNSGEYIQKKSKVPLMGAGGTFVFKFKVNQRGKYKLNFVYKRSWEKDVLYTADINLTVYEEVTEDVVGAEHETADVDPYGRYIYFKENGGNTESVVFNGVELEVVLDGNPTTGYSWILVNDDLKGLEALNEGEYFQFLSEEGMVGVGGIFSFIFKVVDDTNLPKLKFIYKRPWETDPVSTAVVTLIKVETEDVESNENETTAVATDNDDGNEVTDNVEEQEEYTSGNAEDNNNNGISGYITKHYLEENTRDEIRIKQYEILQIELEGNPTTGYSWVLEDDDLKGISYDARIEFISSDESVDGAGGSFIFKFIVNDVNDLPTLKFEYIRPWEDDSIYTAEITLIKEEN